MVPSIAGPKRPQDRIVLTQAAERFATDVTNYGAVDGLRSVPVAAGGGEHAHGGFELRDGAVVIASITSCTNTSNPSVMMAAAMLAKNAVERGLAVKPWVKTSMAPGSKVVTGYYEAAGLWPYLDKLGFNLVGYGCATCIGNSGPLPEEVSAAVQSGDLAVTAVLSGNRNFEGRINPDVKMNYLASPPLVIAYALAGTMDFDFETEPLGTDAAGARSSSRTSGRPRPTSRRRSLRRSRGTCSRRTTPMSSPATSAGSPCPPRGETFAWDASSTYVRKPRTSRV